MGLIYKTKTNNMTTLKFILCAIAAAIGFYLILILPDSTWMDKHGITAAPEYKATGIYYLSYIIGGLIWAGVLIVLYKHFAAKSDT